jgi:hypothetical protein
MVCCIISKIVSGGILMASFDIENLWRMRNQANRSIHHSIDFVTVLFKSITFHS